MKISIILALIVGVLLLAVYITCSYLPLQTIKVGTIEGKLVNAVPPELQGSGVETLAVQTSDGKLYFLTTVDGKQYLHQNNLVGKYAGLLGKTVRVYGETFTKDGYYYIKTTNLEEVK